MFDYLLQFFKLSEENAPPNKRREIHLAWLRCFVAPLNTLNEELFGVFFVDVKAKTKRNGQKIILEDTLNKGFNVGGTNPIHIDNTGDNLENNFLYNSDEGYPPEYFFNESEPNAEPNYFYNESEYEGLSGYVVYVPSSVFANFTEAQIKAEIEKYRVAGTTYKIVQY